MIFWQAFTVSWWSQLGWEAEGSHFFSVEICVWQDSVSFMVVLFHDFKSSRLWMTSPRIQSVEFWSLLWRLGTGWNNKQNTVQISWKTPLAGRWCRLEPHHSQPRYSFWSMLESCQRSAGWGSSIFCCCFNDHVECLTEFGRKDPQLFKIGCFWGNRSCPSNRSTSHCATWQWVETLWLQLL